MKRTILAWLGFACAFGAETLAFAEDAKGEAPATPVMRVYVSGSAAAVSRLSATVRELCARLNLDVVVEEASGEAVLGAAPSGRLRAFVELKSRTPHIVVVDANTNREVERRTLPTSASLEMSIEEAAHVLYMAAESAYSARPPRETAPTPVTLPESQPAAAAPKHDEHEAPKVDVEKRVVSKPAPVAAPTEARHESHEKAPSRFESHVGAFGTAARFAPSKALIGVGGMLDAGARTGAFRISAALSIGMYLPSNVARGAETASLRAETGRLVAVGEWRATSYFAPFLALGGGADRITLDASPSPSAWSAGPEVRIDPMLVALFGANVPLSSAITSFVAFGADVDLAPHRYVVEADGARLTFLELGGFRPAFLWGLSFRLTGSGNRIATGGANP